MLLRRFELHRNKIVISVLTALSVFLFGAETTYASKPKSSLRISYHTDLGRDLDGDEKPESATIRQCGTLYQVNIHFTTGRPKLRLTTHLTDGIAGLTFQTTDIDNDNRGDLVITSATSIRPVAVWLNQGRAKFKKVTAQLYTGVVRYTGAAFRHDSIVRPGPDDNILLDPLPQTTSDVESFRPADRSAELLPFQSESHPFNSLLPQTPSRGPPAASRV